MYSDPEIQPAPVDLFGPRVVKLTKTTGRLWWKKSRQITAYREDRSIAWRDLASGEFLYGQDIITGLVSAQKMRIELNLHHD